MSTWREYRRMSETELAIYGRKYSQIAEENHERISVYIKIFDTVVVIETDENITIPKADFDQTMAKRGQNIALRRALHG
ncbi:hypothetical protein CABS01_16516 [Colletotrichum abscissum]|uniref:Uncharacterized protein n=1 Tax=Colletotrichum tamarilloi TaxID=1209934 RepID=A0ABQ9QH06_9PEZI|nr:uncharacterized protein CTAM01_16969 [Colletotrichum tamarilloi]XP_060405448.1 uncharacterized protein CABS01_16516 [Colletotrichum abscissum]KAK1467995.1 hypothetical protein CTAM01_16969 [Colletotrichum tamarilloi]KAK1521586.1 hypothetical protein CABS01_16516 [Colletotrichum abscissum]